MNLPRTMKKLLLFVASGSFVLGAATLANDAAFYHRYGVDVNDVAGTHGDAVIDWVTGERPLYSGVPAWAYGFGLWLFALVLMTGWAFAAKQKMPSQPLRSRFDSGGG